MNDCVCRAYTIHLYTCEIYNNIKETERLILRNIVLDNHCCTIYSLIIPYYTIPCRVQIHPVVTYVHN